MNTSKQYHGYLALPRHARMLRNNLGNSLFSKYLLLVMDARYDRRNPQIGCVIGTQAEIAQRLGLDQSSLSRTFDVFNKRFRYYVIKNKRYVHLGFFPLFLTDVANKMHSKDYANLHELYADMHRINAELQEKYAKVQEERDQKHAQRLYSSSKENFSSFTEEFNNIELDLGKIDQH